MNAKELTDELTEISLIADNHTKMVLDAAKTMLCKQAEEIEYWKRAFERAMTLNDQIKHLEAQVYGGTTK
jgi:hypothetical protein